MGLKTSTNGKVLYIYVAGNTIDLYDAETYQYLRTIKIPVFSYRIDGNTLSFKWDNVVAGFAMPIRVAAT